ncbi:MAG: hypothetical protein KIT27_11545 [Legionellales bacterium]|nr:hypothetical protein [Legionellales bacterium]
MNQFEQQLKSIEKLTLTMEELAQQKEWSELEKLHLQQSSEIKQLIAGLTPEQKTEKLTQFLTWVKEKNDYFLEITLGEKNQLQNTVNTLNTGDKAKKLYGDITNLE